MKVAFSLARRGLGNVWPNPAVGCIIVKNGRIVGRGWTQPGGRPHAEAMALKQAGEKGLKSLNGLNMNLEQAVLAYEYAVKIHSSRSEIRNFMKVI